MCDGWTLDEAQADLNHRKQRFGWALQGVEGVRPWVYSIGLTERFGHPELVMAGVPIDAAMAMINAVGGADRGGGGPRRWRPPAGG